MVKVGKKAKKEQKQKAKKIGLPNLGGDCMIDNETAPKVVLPKPVQHDSDSEQEEPKQKVVPAYHVIEQQAKSTKSKIRVKHHSRKANSRKARGVDRALGFAEKLNVKVDQKSAKSSRKATSRNEWD
eukprot:c2104_g1_i1.p1 GENE.c2104_g1_i1~~c2104_g1_i1.p1  ORF type:complete len:127 (+),score=40.51 c2104_g1_i1:36-416(+)